VASVVVDGIAVPISVSGHPALDFCNTRAGWDLPQPKEYLKGHRHLCVWAREKGLLSAAATARLRRAAAADPDAAGRVLQRAIALRDALYAVLTGAARPSDWSLLTAEVRLAVAAARLEPAPTTRSPAAWVLAPRPYTVELPLLAVAHAAADLVTSPAGAAVAACPGPGCGWLFTDPRRRRRWCSMAWCGNRSKVRRHAERQRHAQDLRRS
jgi:predicted RNA-binding Zn ribbon-like protein